ncbi:MAG: hypothetical protein SGJ02_11565 [bacterium]|nr:hypothetical protein [bacterium]
MNSLTLLFFIIALFSAWFLVRPHFSKAGLLPSSRSNSSLEEEKERLIQILKDLELDYKTEKIAEGEYQTMRERIRFDLAQALEKLQKT